MTLLVCTGAVYSAFYRLRFCFFFFVFIFLPDVAAAAAAIFQGHHAFLLSCCCCCRIAVASLRNSLEEWIRGHNFFFPFFFFLFAFQSQASPEGDERFFSLTVEEWIRGHAIARSGKLGFEILFAFHHSQTPRRLLLLVNILRYRIERGCHSSINFSCSLNCCIQLD